MPFVFWESSASLVLRSCLESTLMSIAENIEAVRARIAAAAGRAGRNPDEIALMAVSKTMPPEKIMEAISAGQQLFGENRVQEFAAKREAISMTAEFHLIGHLQSNKAAKAAELFDAVDSLDSLRLAERLNEAAGKVGKRLDVLIEVNVGGEAQKAGLAPDSSELTEILNAAGRLPHLQFKGLMTVPPATDDPEGARPYFRALRGLRDRIRDQGHGIFTELSMGMSHDFEVAVEEGSTCVRVGTSIFGARPKP